MHKAKILVIQCIDLRFQKIIDDDVTKNVEYGQFDRIAWPGASKDFENVKTAAEISIKLHNPDEIIIYEHEDCGAYGEDNTIEIHRKNAQKLANSLKEIKPDLQVHLKIASQTNIQNL